MSNIVFAQNFKHELDSLLIAHTSLNKTGVAFLIIKNNEEIYKKGFGLANIQTNEPISPISNFRMASISKQFTAMCIMLLAKQKKINYEDNLLKFFPDFNENIGSKIKIKHLLTHSSGIIDYEELIPENQQQQLLDLDVLNLIKIKTKIILNLVQSFNIAILDFVYSNKLLKKFQKLVLYNLLKKKYSSLCQ